MCRIVGSYYLTVFLHPLKSGNVQVKEATDPFTSDAVDLAVFNSL